MDKEGEDEIEKKKKLGREAKTLKSLSKRGQPSHTHSFKKRGGMSGGSRGEERRGEGRCLRYNTLDDRAIELNHHSNFN